MEALLVGLVVVVLTVATAMFLAAVWRHMWPAVTAERPRVRRGAIAACCAVPAVVALTLALVDVSDVEAFFGLAVITISSLGLGIWISLRRT